MLQKFKGIKCIDNSNIVINYYNYIHLQLVAHINTYIHIIIIIVKKYKTKGITFIRR